MRYICCFFLLHLPANAVVTWTGAGVSVTGTTEPFDESNWDLPTGITAINPNTDIDDDVLVEGGNIVLPQIDGGSQRRFQLEAGRTLTFRNATATLGGGSNDGYGRSGGGQINIVLENTNFTTYFIVGVNMTVDAASSVAFGGPGNPINNSTVDLVLGSDITFLRESSADVISEHLSKITVNGSAAVIGINVDLISLSATSSQLITIPELNTGLLLLAGLGLGFLRRRV